MSHKKLVKDIKAIASATGKKLTKEKPKNPKRYKSKEKKLSRIRTELRNLRDSI